MDHIDNLERLARLRTRGAIDEQEFEKLKRRILGKCETPLNAPEAVPLDAALEPIRAHAPSAPSLQQPARRWRSAAFGVVLALCVLALTKGGSLSRRESVQFEARLASPELLVVRAGEQEIQEKVFEQGSGSYLRYYVVSDPFEPIVCSDGLPDAGRNAHLSEVATWTNQAWLATARYMPTFKFFNDNSTSVGFIVAETGGNSYFRASLFIADIKTGDLVKLPVEDCDFNIWFDKSVRPPLVQEVTHDFLGRRSSAAGYAGRIDRVLRYDPAKKQYSQDTAIESQVFASKFRASRVIGSKVHRLRHTSLDEIDAEDARDLLDFLYYGKKLGKTDEVASLKGYLHSSIVEAIESRNW